jgi:hypothetical protein
MRGGEEHIDLSFALSPPPVSLKTHHPQHPTTTQHEDDNDDDDDGRDVSMTVPPMRSLSPHGSGEQQQEQVRPPPLLRRAAAATPPPPRPTHQLPAVLAAAFGSAKLAADADLGSLRADLLALLHWAPAPAAAGAKRTRPTSTTAAG